MKTTTDKKLSMYKYAVMCKLDLHSTDFEIKKDFTGYIVKTKDGAAYKVMTDEDLTEMVTCYLDDPEILIPPNYWADVAEKVHFDDDFCKHFTATLEESVSKKSIKERHKKEIIKCYNNIISKNPDAEIFWKMIDKAIDDVGGEIYNHCVWASVRTYDKKIMIDELRDLFVSNKYFNEIQNGVFEDFFIREDEGEDFHLSFDDNDILFYIYSVDPASWEVKEVTNG
jgi:hypothetical protein